MPNLNVQSNGEVTLNPLSGMHNVGPATMIGQYSPASVAAAAVAAAAVSRGASTPKQVLNLLCNICEAHVVVIIRVDDSVINLFMNCNIAGISPTCYLQKKKKPINTKYLSLIFLRN